VIASNMSEGVRVWVATQPVDMRKGFDGLAEVVRAFLGHDPLSGSMFVFRNRSAQRVKVLWYDRDGLAIYYKKQESDCTRRRPFTGSLGHTDNFARRPLTAGGVGSHQESSRARRRPMSRNGSVLAPPRARRTSGRRRSIASGVC
jgi:IS66 Orf2 like protein